jgi:hypothetical protein
MGGDSRLQKSMAVMAAIKKGMASVGELKDKCNDAIRKGVDLNGIAERQRIPVGGVHGRNYMKLVRDDVAAGLKETALAKGKGRLLPGFGDLLDEDQKVRGPHVFFGFWFFLPTCGANPPPRSLLPYTRTKQRATWQHRKEKQRLVLGAHASLVRRPGHDHPDAPLPLACSHRRVAAAAPNPKNEKSHYFSPNHNQSLILLHFPPRSPLSPLPSSSSDHLQMIAMGTYKEKDEVGLYKLNPVGPELESA